MTFDEFGIDSRCLKVLEKNEIRDATPIQEAAIPRVLEKKDVVGIAQTGTGKTLGYVLPSLTNLAKRKPARNCMLVLVPTRELCTQVSGVMREYGNAVGVTSCSVYGGVSIQRQADALKEGRQVVVATPGRLLDHMRRRNVRFDNLRTLVLDEADRMLDMGFLPDIQDIIKKLPAKRQTLMFSATFPAPIARLADKMMNNPERIEVGQVSKPVESVRQRLFPVREEHKTRLITRIVEEEDIGSALIFLRTRDRTEKLARILRKKGFHIAELHGDRSQSQRQQALNGFRKGRFDILVATDVAARGLDIEDVSHVINYDIPLNADDYIHRIGRTARAKREGDAITFVTPNEHQALATIERALGENIERVDWEDAPTILTLYHPPGAKRGTRRGRRGRRPVRRR